MTDVHYLSAILERLNNLYERLREHISDEVDWVEAEIERLSLPAAQTPLSPALTEPTREALEDARRLIGNLLHQPVGDPRNAPSIITFEHTLPYGFVAWAQKHIAAALIHPAPAAEAPFDLEVILGSYRIGDATYEETSAAIMALFAAPAAQQNEGSRVVCEPCGFKCAHEHCAATSVSSQAGSAPTEPTREALEAEIDRRLGDLLAKVCSHAAIDEAMQDAWNDICSDTGCHPLDIEHGRGKHLTFKPSHWANQIAKRLFVGALKRRLEILPTSLTHPAPAAQQNEPEAPFELEVILGSYRIGDATYEETVESIARLYAAPPAPSSPPGMREAFQARVHPWLMACFGPDISADKIERNYRFIEEALELVQACGCTQSDAHQLVDYVYGRPDGDINHEVGGVMVTLAALCLANGFDMHAAGETELVRIWGKVEAIRAKQAAKPRHSPLPGTPPSPEPAASPLGEERSHGTERQAAIADVVQYLESEGHGIPAEKVRAAFDAPVESDCEEKDR